MITIFHILPLFGASIGLWLGAVGGAELFGPWGTIGGALVGCTLGFFVGRLPFLLSLLWLRRRLAATTTPELRADLRRGDCLIPNMLLLELRRRGEDIHSELPVVLDLLVSDNLSQRGFGWAALTSAFPELAASLPDYRLYDSVEICRRKTERLREATNP